MVQATRTLNRRGETLAQLLFQDGIRNSMVLKAIANTPRELFLPEALQHKAYQNTALPIGQGQTISQPYIVAKMTEILLSGPTPAQKILEIGTGSGYQCAILAQLFQEVYSVERIKSLQFQAKRRMQKLDLHNIKMKHGDGWEGWASKGPYDAIMVTAAASSLPQALLQQLAPGGQLIIPLGTNQQQLKVYRRDGESISEQVIENVRFVPLVPGELL
ncbi:protein-L-isoaspartate(D-aspartate) O-methyltransferase [Planctobacterium marinum]|uniref:protein-L-isoaspartate(D-aspartate) O-methyltransferase n=1 Tax=Planctobacterium marinum TaxID=1631968 RepID=UPI001E3D7F2C|nr:protein-L-isoaspartate(D-aspartate) O-methyltransferase [Planctobacterium marinum]MCC2605268.1 protein-L-isoaspartate(D-aspartate) O-methyltransferase [Planctobacterium marinum]